MTDRKVHWVATKGGTVRHVVRSMVGASGFKMLHCREEGVWVHECDDEQMQRLRYCYACKKAMKVHNIDDPDDWFFALALSQMDDSFEMEAIDKDLVWEITVRHPLKKLRYGTVRRDVERQVLIVKDEGHIEEIPLRDVVKVEQYKNGYEDQEAIPLRELFDTDRVMAMMKEADEKADPKWMVPVIFDAPDEETAFHIKDTIEMLVKHGAFQYADMNDRHIHAFGLMRFDMWNGIQEFVERPKKK